MKCQVHAIPTDKPLANGLSPLKSSIQDKWRLEITGAGARKLCEQGSHIPYHLYFTSGEEIKDGDWFYAGEFSKPEQASVFDTEFVNGFLKSGCRKIVATTNCELWPSNRSTTWEYDEAELNDGMGKIPEDFIQAFVESNGSIKEVELEEKENYDIKYQKCNGFETAKRINYPNTLKLNPDGSVIWRITNESILNFSINTESILLQAIREGFKLAIRMSNTFKRYDLSELDWRKQEEAKLIKQLTQYPKEKMYTMDELRKAAWDFGADLWEGEYGENPNEGKTNMTEIFAQWFNKNYPLNN